MISRKTKRSRTSSCTSRSTSSKFKTNENQFHLELDNSLDCNVKKKQKVALTLKEKAQVEQDSQLQTQTAATCPPRVKDKKGICTDVKLTNSSSCENVSSFGSKMSTGFTALSESCNLSRRQATLLSKRRAAEELELARQARQQELEAESAEIEAETNNKKPKKDPEIWTEAEKDIFFQGVLTVGRDFDKLQKYYISKMKSKEHGERSKDQIRMFYYRIVKNIQSIINLTKVSRNKEANELFAVVNFVEFRRRVGSRFRIINQSEKLTQLICKGQTNVKLRGKLLKIRSPTCPTLLRLFEKANEDAKSCAGAEKKKVVLKKARVPEFITVELQPKTNVALRRVSGISHNPHLRLKVKAEQNLATVIEAVERKWVPSTVRIRKELNLEEEWDHLPHIRIYPASTATLQPFDLSLFSNNTPTIFSFERYLKIEESQQSEESGEKTPAEDNGGDPVKFLKDKLSDITSQLQESCDNKDGTGTKKARKGNPSRNLSHIKSHSWIEQSKEGWTIKNCTDLSLGYLYLLYGSPDKISMEYDWPELQNADGVAQVFAGMINKLMTVAESEFTVQISKRKQAAAALNSPTTSKSPSTRGKRKSPSTPKTPKPSKSLHIKPGPARDSPEFKKPGVPLLSEGRQLADAIALGRQELRPYARKPTVRPQLVQKNILPNQIAVKAPVPRPPYNLYPKPMTNTTPSSVKTQVMDISCITRGSNVKYTTLKEESESAGHPKYLASMIKSSRPMVADNSSKSELISTLNNLINSPASSSTGKNAQLVQLQELLASAGSATSESSGDNSQDILTQAMAAIRTPTKRRITPTMLSPTVEGVNFSTEIDSSSLFSELTDTPQKEGSLEGDKSHNLNNSDHSMSSLLRSLDAVSGVKGSEVANESSLFSSENLVGGQQDSPLINSFQGLIDNEANKECGTQANIDNTLPVLPSSSAAAPVKDAWLTPDVALNDFSLSSLLGDKSPRRQQTEASAPLGSGLLASDRPPSTLNSDDTRMSFLNKLDVNDLGVNLMDSSFPNMMGGDSVDYMAKFDSISAELETPQKKTS